VTPARPDLAAAHLKGVVEAPRYVDGEKFSIAVGRASLRTRPSGDAPQDSEVLFGEGFTVYDRAQGWAWGQAASDLYVGYVREEALAAPFATQAKVSALQAPLFPAADLKTPVRDLLPMNAAVPVLERSGDYVRIGENGYLHQRHLMPADKDFVAVAERFLGVPYVWGGRTFAGLDCSGLIQTALEAAGVEIPRDSDQQEAALTTSVPFASDLSGLERGDILFWTDHVGVMLDGKRLLHANGFYGEVAIEPLGVALERITASGKAVTSVKRL